MRTRIAVFLVLMLKACLAIAQDYRLEVIPKASFLAVEISSPAAIQCRYVPALSLEAVYFIRPKVGVGIYYTKSLFNDQKIGTANNEFQSDDLNWDGDRVNSAYHHYGVDVKVSTDRTRRFRIYGTAGILKAEQFIDFKHFKTGVSGIGYSLGVGSAIKISRTIFLNLFDARFILYNKQFGYDREGSPSYGAKVDSGLIFKFMRIR